LRKYPSDNIKIAPDSDSEKTQPVQLEISQRRLFERSDSDQHQRPGVFANHTDHYPADHFGKLATSDEVILDKASDHVIRNSTP
jgi:hypothetical protein